MTANPLLESFNTLHGVPPFGQISPNHYVPAIKAAIEQALDEIGEITGNTEPPTFDNTIVALELTGKTLGNATSVLFNLNSAETNEATQKAAMEVSPMLTEYSNDISQNKQLFDRIKAVYKVRDSLPLTGEQQMLLEKTYKGFVRNGANLEGADKDAYRRVTRELAEAELKYGENLLAETNKFEMHITDQALLSGLNEDVLAMAAETAASKGKEGWVFTLQAPSYVPFMEQADSRALRQQMFLAYMTKCVKGDELDNSDLIAKIVALRLEKAKLLGYDCYADYVLEERMAKSSKEVNVFLNDLLHKAMPKAKEEYAEILEFAAKNGFPADVQRWDWAYLSEKLKKEKYDLNDELLKPYFKLENVIDGVFKVAEKLFGISFRLTTEIPVYHKDVTTYEVYDLTGKFLAVFYADFFPREGKRGGAWMTNYRDQSNLRHDHQRPVVSIVCNFTPSTATKPSLLGFDEVETLFHEFGHALHSILSDVTYASLAGTNVYWDFVELPSQIMENWVKEKQCLDLFARHYQTGESIPQEYIDRINAAARYHEAYQTVRQLSFAMLDMQWHSFAVLPEQLDVVKFEKEVFSATDLFPRVEGTCMSTQFSHIFAGGYAAGYYSYKWAEVLDADAFAYFKERGIFDPEVSRAFKDHILSKGGSEHPMDLYVKFRKKKPTVDALLERSGLV